MTERLGKLVLQVKQQSNAFLADFMKLVAAYEIPIVSIDSDAGGIVTHSSRGIEADEWCRHRAVSFPFVQSTYVMDVRKYQADAISVFVGPRKKFCEIVVKPEFV